MKKLIILLLFFLTFPILGQSSKTIELPETQGSKPDLQEERRVRQEWDREEEQAQAQEEKERREDEEQAENNGPE